MLWLSSASRLSMVRSRLPARDGGAGSIRQSSSGHGASSGPGGHGGPSAADGRVPLAPPSHAVACWLIVCAAMIFAMVVIGGVTRLTESGLSIVEWKPVTGALPPLSDAEWQAEFD